MENTRVRKISHNLLACADCILILPVTLLVVGSIRFLPAPVVIKVAGLLHKLTSFVPARAENEHYIYDRWTRALRRIQKYLKIRMTCLGKAVILRTMLRTSGVSAEIKLGATQSSELLVAHAWIEIPGVPIDECAQAQYVEFPSHPFQ